MSNRVEDLVPSLQPKALALLEKAPSEIGKPIKVTHTLRTHDEQAHIWAKGRTIPGEPCTHNGIRRLVGTCPDHPMGATVTNARPGFSWHHAFLPEAGARAFDVAFQGKNPYPKDDALWLRLGRLGQSLWLEWRPGDMPHFQDRGGLTLAQARARHRTQEALA